MRAIDSVLRPFGFARKGAAWYLRKDDAILGVWLQSSRYAKGGYLNFLAWYPGLATREFRSFANGDFHLDFRGPDELRDAIWKALRYDETEIELQAYATLLKDLVLESAATKLLSLSKLNAAIDRCKADDRSIAYSLELQRAASDAT